MVLHMLARENFNIKVRKYDRIMIVSKQGQKMSLRAKLLLVTIGKTFFFKYWVKHTILNLIRFKFRGGICPI